MRYILVPFLLLFYLPSDGQLFFFKKKTSEIVINAKDAVYKIHVAESNKKMKLNNDLTYFWYKSNDIKQTKGGVDGKLLHGRFTAYYPDNNLKEKGNFKNGLKQGEWRTWMRDGRLQSVAHCRKGLQDGLTVTYNEKSEKITEAKYRKGKLHGETISYKEGKETERKVYKNGEEVLTPVQPPEKKIKNNEVIPLNPADEPSKKEKPVQNVPGEEKPVKQKNKKEKSAGSSMG